MTHTPTNADFSGKETQEHRNTVSDYRPVDYFEEKRRRLGLPLLWKNSDIHVFDLTCADSRVRSTRIDAAEIVLRRWYEQNGNTIDMNTIEVAGTTFFVDEMQLIREKIARAVNTSRKRGRKAVILIEGMGHSEVVNREGEWKTNPGCSYHCGMTHGDAVAKEMQDELLAEGCIQIPLRAGQPEKFALSGEPDVIRFMEANYNFSGPLSNENGDGYISGIPDPKEHIAKEYDKLLSFFSNQIARGDMDAENIRTYVHDIRDLTLWPVRGKPGGWRWQVHQLASLEPGETPYFKRLQKQEPKVMAITHPRSALRATMAVIETLNLPKHLTTGNVFVTSSRVLTRGRVPTSVHAGLYYYARHLKGEWVHIRGRTQDETNRFHDLIINDSICNWVISKYGLRVLVHNNAREEELLKRAHAD